MKICRSCGKMMDRANYTKKVWGEKKPISDYHWSVKKYCDDKCKQSAKSKRQDRSEYITKWRSDNEDKLKKYYGNSKESRRKASLRYYYKKR